MSPDSSSLDELAAMFLRELEAAGGHGFVCESQEDLVDRVEKLCRSRSVLIEESPSTKFIGTALIEAGANISTTTNIWDAEVGITGVDMAVAATGTLVLLAGHNRLLAASLLPYTFIALVDRSSLVADFEQLIKILNDRLTGSTTEPNRPSAIHLITGPSRTGDVEMQLTIGVHGPPEVYAFIYP